MKILVTYYSRSGNTEQLAQAIARGVEEVEGVKAVLKPCGEVEKQDMIDCAGLVAGSPVYFGTMAAELKAMLDKFVGVRRKMEGKVGAAFATSADLSGGKETTVLSILQAMLIYGMVVMGDPLSATGHYGACCVGKPDEDALDRGRKLGHRVAEVAMKLRS